MRLHTTLQLDLLPEPVEGCYGINACRASPDRKVELLIGNPLNRKSSQIEDFSALYRAAPYNLSCSPSSSTCTRQGKGGKNLRMMGIPRWEGRINHRKSSQISGFGLLYNITPTNNGYTHSAPQPAPFSLCLPGHSGIK